MHGWVRSISVLSAAFGGVVIVTMGLAGLIVPERPAPSSPTASVPAGGAGPGARPDPVAPIPGIGGTIAVAGAHEGSFELTRARYGVPFALEGSGDRITFAGAPVEVSQISYNGLEFFPDPGQCTLTTGNLDNAIGIGFAELRCDQLVDIRDGGTVSMSGEIGVPLDLLVERQLPPSGGSLAVGGETWEFEEATLSTWQMPATGGVSQYSMSLEDLGGPPRVLNFHYDFETHLLSLANVAVGNAEANVADGSCSFDRAELGQHNPRTLVVELSISCAAVEVPELGRVAISGSVVVDELQWPD